MRAVVLLCLGLIFGEGLNDDGGDRTHIQTHTHTLSNTHLSSIGTEAALASAGRSKKVRARAQAWSITFGYPWGEKVDCDTVYGCRNDAAGGRGGDEGGWHQPPCHARTS